MTAAGVQEITEVLNMQAGGSVVYHMGMLAVDREASEEVKETANIAWKLYENGAVLLTQRKIAPMNYQYIATKRARRGS